MKKDNKLGDPIPNFRNTRSKFYKKNTIFEDDK